MRFAAFVVVLGVVAAGRAEASELAPRSVLTAAPVPVESPAGALPLTRVGGALTWEQPGADGPCTPPPLCEPPPDPCAPVDPCTSPWSFNAGLALSLAKGNSDSFDLAADGSATFSRYPWGFSAKVLFAYGEKDGSTSTEAWHAGLHGERHLDRRIYAFARLDFDRDVPAGLESRWTALAGLGAKLIDARTVTLRGELGGGTTWEKRTGLPRTGDPAAYVGLDFKKTWDDASVLEAGWKFVPNLSTFDLSLMTWQLKFAKPLSSVIDLTVTLRVDRVIDPPAPAEPTDVLLAVGLRARF